eukprot:COSAG04_NODE_71_length_29147_cov_8.406018_11_plen_327_part_00
MALLLAALALTAASTADVVCPPDAGAMGAAELRQWLRSVGVAEDSVALAAENAMDGASMGAASQEALVSVLRLPLGTAALIHRCFQPPAASTAAPPGQKNFGYGLSQGHIHVAQEETLYEYNVSSPASTGVLTHWWITGGVYMCGNDTTSCSGPGDGIVSSPPHPRPTRPAIPSPLRLCRMQGSNGAWNPFIDFVIFRYYIDGEETPSIEFSPNMACGVGPFANRTGTASTPPNPAVGPHRLDPQAGGRPTDGYPMGAPQAHAPWTAKYFGKGSADGGWCEYSHGWPSHLSTRSLTQPLLLRHGRACAFRQEDPSDDSAAAGPGPP